MKYDGQYETIKHTMQYAIYQRIFNMTDNMKNSTHYY